MLFALAIFAAAIPATAQSQSDQAKAPPAVQSPGAKQNLNLISEIPVAEILGSLFHKLTIVKLKEWHSEKQLERIRPDSFHYRRPKIGLESEVVNVRCQ